MRRSLLLIGAGALAVAALAVYVVRGSDSARGDTGTRPTTSTARAPGAAAPTRDPVRTPYWVRKAAAEAREQSALPAPPTLPAPGTAGTADTPDTAGAAAGASLAPADRRRVAAGFRPMRPPSEAQIARSIRSYEAKHGPLDRAQRAALVKQLKHGKPPADHVPGASALREKLAAQSCTGPSAQQHYRQLSAAGQLEMRKRCAPYGFTPP